MSCCADQDTALACVPTALTPEDAASTSPSFANCSEELKSRRNSRMVTRSVRRRRDRERCTLSDARDRPADGGARLKVRLMRNTLPHRGLNWFRCMAHRISRSLWLKTPYFATSGRASC